MPEREVKVWIRYGDGETRVVPLDQARLESFGGSVPWRRLRSRKGQSHLSGRYWSSTTGGHVVYESWLELARLLLADFDPDVAGIWAQPCRLEATVGGASRGHVPDFLMFSASGLVTVVNVKPAERLADVKVAEALAWPGRLFADRGWRVEVWSGSDLVVLDLCRTWNYADRSPRVGSVALRGRAPRGRGCWRAKHSSAAERAEREPHPDVCG